MRSITFTLFTLLTLSLILIAEQHNPLGSSIPRLGAFLSPFEGFWQNAEAADLATDQELNLPGLQKPVQVIMDERLVPHVFAQNTEDAVFTQGYLTAKYRLWQIDFASRAISGRLSEVLGERALEYDRLQRRLGFAQNAKQALTAWQNSDIDRQLVKSYTDGINAYLENLQPAQAL